MPLKSLERDLQAIRQIIEQHPKGIAAAGIEAALDPALPRRTLGRRLAEAVKRGIVRREGIKATALYFPTPEQTEARSWSTSASLSDPSVRPALSRAISSIVCWGQQYRAVS